MGDDGCGSLISSAGVAPSQIGGVFASDIFPCTIKYRRRFILAPTHLGSPRKMGCKTVVCVCFLTATVVQLCLQCFDAVGWVAGMVVWPVKTECIIICLERGADDLHVVQLMPLPTRHLLLS